MRIFRGLAWVLLLLALAAPAAAEDVGSEKMWGSIIDGVEQSIQNQRQTLDKFYDELEALEKNLNYGLAKADNRLSQILLLRSVAGDTPWAYRTLSNQFLALHAYVELHKRPLEERKSTLLQARNDYRDLSEIEAKSRSRYPRSSTTLALAQPVRELHQLKQEVLKAKENINKALAPSDSLLQQIKAARNATLDTYYSSLESYYMKPSAVLWSFEGLFRLRKDLLDWGSNTPRFWAPLIIWVHWGEFFGYLLLYWALSFFSCWLLLRWAARRASFGNPRPLRFGLAMLTLAGAILAALCDSLFTMNQLTMLAIPVFATLGLQQMCRELLHPAPVAAQRAPDESRDGGEENLGDPEMEDISVEKSTGAEAESSPPPSAVGLVRRTSLGSLFPLWLLMVGGVLLQAANTPAMLLQFVWLIFLIATGVWVFRHTRRVVDPVEKFLLRASLWFMGAMAGMTVFGFAALALVLFQAWFMLLLVVQILRLAHRGLGRLARRREEEYGANAGARALRELVYPLAVLVALYAYSIWALFYMGGPDFTKWVMRLDWTIGTVHLTFRGLAWILIAFFGVRLSLVLMRSGLESGGFRGRRLNQAKAHTVSTMAAYVVWVLYMLFCLNVLEVSLKALTWIASGLSVGIGFGLKDLVNNFISGLIVLFGGNIKKGDIIQTDPKTMGEVVSVSVRNTIVRTLDNRTIIVPNQKFLSGEITNWSYKSDKLRLTLPISVIPGTKIKKMEKVLLKAARKNPEVLEDPAPQVVALGFGQLGLDFQLQFWIDDFNKKYKIETDLMAEIDKGFQEKKIIPAFRTVRKKYKPKGSEQMQLEAQREALKEKRRAVYSLFRAGARRHIRQWRGLADSPIPRNRPPE
jgi:small-conductance mechanosensitive channel